MRQITSLDDLKGYTGLAIFSAAWCGPCKGYKPALQKFADEHELHLVEVDAGAHKDLAGTYGVRAVPATFYFVNGEPFKSKTGALQGAQIAELCPDVKN